ncbi:MAG TPA: zinc finger domain-containing protein, partial [Oscillospiraceae bacterium]|nr:zinc finger domain-containing protein [Oscillospiraceae bacterium]
ALLTYRDVVTRRLEEARQEKRLGSSLTAALELYPDQTAYDALLPFKERLAEIFIVSACTLHEPDAGAAETVVEQGLGVAVKTAAGEKCERCWMIHPQLGIDATHPTLCPRCTESVIAQS